MVVLAVALVAGVLVLRGGDGDDDAGTHPSPDHTQAIGRDGSVDVGDGQASRPIEIVRSPASFRITYRLEELGTGGRSVDVSTDVVSVRRPWESRLDTKKGAPPGGDVLSSQVAAFARRSTVPEAGNGEPSTLELAPAIPASDVRAAPVLAAALEHGVVERREVREVAGRRCQVYRSGASLAATVYTKPTDDEYGDTCVDEAGLVLEEVLVFAGRATFRRVATTVEEDVALTDDLFAVQGGSIAVRDGGGRVRRLQEDSFPPGEVLVLPAPPEGFTHQGRYSVVPAQPENFGDDPTRAANRRAGTVDVWVHGIDVLVLDQGGTLYGAEPFTIDPTRPAVDLGGVAGTGELLLGGLGAEVRSLRGNGKYVRVYGTLTPDELVDVARSLQVIQGNELRFAD